MSKVNMPLRLPDLGLKFDDVIGEIRFDPANEVEGFEMWKYEHQDDGVLKHEKLPDDKGRIEAWLRKVCPGTG